MGHSLKLHLSLQDFWVSQVGLDFFTDYYFSRFFGSKILGIISLLTLFFLIFKFKSKFFINSSKYLFLLIFLLLSYILPILYGLVIEPVLTDRYIIFVLIPVILFISIFTINLKNKKIKNFILILIIASTISNNYLEIFKREHTKPEFNKIFKDISQTNFNYIYLKTPDEINRKLLSNYIKLSKSFDNKKFIILNPNELVNQNNVWQICYKAINYFDCSPDKKFKMFSIKKKINYYLIEATLYSL